MSGEPRTRHLGVDELARALEPFAESQAAVAARPIHVARDAAPTKAPATERAVEARPSATLARSGSVDAQLLPARRRRARWWGWRAWHGWQAWQAWLAAIVLAGFALGGLIALTVHATRATARVPPAAIKLPPALPTLSDPTPTVVPTVSALQPEVAREVGPALANRRHAVDALLAGRSRIALEHYRRLLASSGSLSDRASIEQVVRVLARELRHCEQEAGTPCGF